MSPDLRSVLAAALLLAASALPGAAAAHDGVVHKTQEEARAHLAAYPALGHPLKTSELPFRIEPDFDLIDQNGERVTQDSFAGRHYVIFFGYAVNQALCSVSFDRLAETRDLLADAGLDLEVVLITVNPEADTPEAMRKALPEIGANLHGLTGGQKALKHARDAFQAKAEKVSELPDGTPIYSHTGLVYLVSPEGEVLTLLPPIMSADKLAEVFAGYF